MHQHGMRKVIVILHFLRTDLTYNVIVGFLLNEKFQKQNLQWVMPIW